MSLVNTKIQKLPVFMDINVGYKLYLYQINEHSPVVFNNKRIVTESFVKVIDYSFVDTNIVKLTYETIDHCRCACKVNLDDDKFVDLYEYQNNYFLDAITVRELDYSEKEELEERYYKYSNSKL